MEYTKQLNKISRIISEIPYEQVYIEIKTKNDKYTLEKYKETPVIGFKAGGTNG